MTSTNSVDVHEGQAPFKRVCALTTAVAGRFGWKMHDIVDGSLEVARNDPAFDLFGQEALLALGNMVVIRNPRLPRPWVGFVQKPKWTISSPTISVPLKQAERVLAERTLPKGFSVSGSAGDIFRRCFEMVNLTNQTYIFPCSNPTPGPTLSLNLGGKTLFDALNTLADTAGMEWWLDPVVSPAGVKLTCYWASQRGEDLSGAVVLREGQIADGSYVQDETNLAVEVSVVGGGSTFALRPSARASLLPSTTSASETVTTADEIAPVSDAQRARIDPWTVNPASKRQVSIVRPTVTDPSTLSAGASSALDTRYRGPEEMSATLDITDPLLMKFWLGDVVRLWAPSLGPNGISLPFRISEIAPSDTQVVLNGRADGGLLRPKYAALQDMRENISDLQRGT